MDGAECTNGICRHELQSNTADSRCQPSVSQFSGEGLTVSVTVSVTARSIVGRSNPVMSNSFGELSVYFLFNWRLTQICTHFLLNVVGICFSLSSYLHVIIVWVSLTYQVCVIP